MTRVLKAASAAMAVVLMVGCWNGDNDTISLGSVSIGQQMIDLKAALEQDAITREEYDRLKATLMVIDGGCGAAEDDG